ncbi:MAG: RnfABCDGE type electron transport complex subunit D [Candidatus Omnitrophota bacterium]|jgi:electron transport complex protein RnfD|nr:MAG: RnfABCDGE type electron transport complex subunit D [Candidatus Omnitrophota bacterium]
MQNRLIVSTSPHLRGDDNTSKIMWAVCFALLPSGIASVAIFGISALKVIVASVLSCVITEAAVQKMTKRKVSVSDGSAFLTGLLLAYNLSSSVPLWLPVVGGMFAIIICKQFFGGLGKNIFNPALAARAFLLASWPKHMTSFVKPFDIDAVTSATPLAMLKEAKVDSFSQLGLSYLDLFIGNRGGCLGEVCIIALLIGAAYLLWKGYIWWHTPASFISTVALLSFLFSPQGFMKGDILFSIISGGLILGAFFMATDYVTTPLTSKGQLIFGFGCGVITFIIRRFGGYPEGVSYSILIMNAAVPLIDRYVRPRIYGVK